MKIGVVNEARVGGETRVALAPESVKKLVGAKFEVVVERGAGLRAHFGDAAFEGAGAVMMGSAREVLGAADVVVGVGAPSGEAIGGMRAGAILVTSLMPTRNVEAVRALAARGVTVFSTDAIPRTTRAQTMDTLSSMANIAGYRGVLIGAAELGRYFPMLMTAAGTVLAAKVFVIGAGVAGLQAIATARRLGATVSATDVRPEVKEQIESVGAKYVGIELKQSAAAGGGYAKELTAEDKQRQAELLGDQCAAADVVITTALIGGVFAPKLISAEVVRRMKAGSVIVDLAADGGGNCELSQPGKTVNVTPPDVTICAPLNVAAGMATHASVLWSRNLTAFLMAFSKDGVFAADEGDEIIRGAMITKSGEVVHGKTREAMGVKA